MWLPWRWGIVVSLAALGCSWLVAWINGGVASRVPRGLAQSRLGRAAASVFPRGERSGTALTIAPQALREVSLVMALYSLWQYAGQFSVMGVGAAVDRARWVVRFQHSMHIPSERSVQALLLPHPLLVKACNAYYAVVHVPALVFTLFWAFFVHRAHYRRLRNALALTTLGCLIVQLIPLAPPRMLEDLGFVDTGLLYGQSVYNALGRGMAGQLAAMPSVHVAWALIIAWFGLVVRCRRWTRAVALAHGVVTVIVVVGTGNHFWLDGIVAAMLLAASLGIIAAFERAPDLRPGYRWRKG